MSLCCGRFSLLVTTQILFTYWWLVSVSHCVNSQVLLLRWASALLYLNSKGKNMHFIEVLNNMKKQKFRKFLTK
jgi:hypothetical protein